MLGISTCWKSKEIRDGNTLIKEMLDLELDGLELEYRINSEMFNQMLPTLIEDRTKIFSIHNFFPVPDVVPPDSGNGDVFLLSSENVDERTQAIKYTIKSIQSAVDLGSGAVVLHLGRTMIPTIKPKLIEFYNLKMICSKPYVSFMKEAKKLRTEAKQKNFNCLLMSLEKVFREADKLGIKLGIENRYYFREFPDFDEIGFIFEKFEGAGIGYWHDTGHAKVNENFGIIGAAMYLEAYGDKLLGVHLHDVQGYTDHLAPGTGEINFDDITPYLKPDTLKIIEVHPQVTKNDLIKGIDFLKNKGII